MFLLKNEKIGRGEAVYNESSATLEKYFLTELNNERDSIYIIKYFNDIMSRGQFDNQSKKANNRRKKLPVKVRFNNKSWCVCSKGEKNKQVYK